MSLQDLCIKAIVDKFEKYYIAFSKSIDPNVTRKFEFLQRVYSYEIASKLYESNKLRADYVDLLVNKYLKTLNTDWFKDCPWETVAAKFAEVGPNFRKVYFPRCYLCSWNTDWPWLDVIHHLTSLEVLSFPCNCNDEILKYISQFCPNIVEIDASYSVHVTNKGIQYLCMKKNGKPLCPNLRKLLIQSSNVNEEGIKYLIQNLRSLEMTDKWLPEVLFSLHKNDLSALNMIEPYKLTSLDLFYQYREPHYTDLLKVCLFVCPCLKSLTCAISNKEHLDLFSSPLELEILYLENFRRSFSVDITDVLKMVGGKLTSLTVSNLPFSVSSLSDSCPCLKELHLCGVSLQNDNDGATPLFKHLESCIFDDYGTLDNATVKSISLLLMYAPKLEHINFNCSDLSSSELKTAILRHVDYPIKTVKFLQCLVDIHFIKAILLSFHSLKLFNLVFCGIHRDARYELYNIAKVLPNNPEIDIDYVERDDVSGSYDSDDYDVDDDDDLEVVEDDCDVDRCKCIEMMV